MVIPFPAVGIVVTGLSFVALLEYTEFFINEYGPTIGALYDSASDNSKNERHGDPNAESKVERQLADLEAQLQTATGNTKKKIKQKIQNIKKTAKGKGKGETHSRNAKGN